MLAEEGSDDEAVLAFETAAEPAMEAAEDDFQAEEEVVADFHQVLKRRMPILEYVSFASVAGVPSVSSGAFAVSRETRELLSSLVSVDITFDIMASASESPRTAERIRNRLERAVARLHRSKANELAVHLMLPLKEVPLRRASFNRGLSKAIPMILWEDVHEMRIRCRDNLGMMDRGAFSIIRALEGADVLPLVCGEEVFKRVTKINLSVPQIMGLPTDFCMPQVERLKIICQDIALADAAFERLAFCFPSINRMHLFMLPIGLLPLCGPGFSAPRDLRLTLDPNTNAVEREVNVFVASHLMTLPFSWGDCFFRQVMRLQMGELNQNHGGLSMEKLASVIRGLPLLRRLGTVSLNTCGLLDIASDDFHLEELVLVTEVDDLWKLFRLFAPLEGSKRRTTLKRFAVHLLASDGSSRLKIDIENAICAAWYNIAANMLQPDGWIVFSVATRQLMETANVQLPWFMPSHFAIDAVEYDAETGRQPLSTPMDRQLTYYGTDGTQQPNGTLVSGPLRPSAEGFTLDVLIPESPGGRSSPPVTPSTRRTVGTRGNTPMSRGGKKNRFSDIIKNMSIVDCMEILRAQEEKHAAAAC